MKQQLLIIIVFYWFFGGPLLSCSSDKKSNSLDSNKKIDSTHQKSSNLNNKDKNTSYSKEIPNTPNDGEIIKDENECIGTRDCSVEELRAKIKNRHNKLNNSWDVSYGGGSPFNSYIDNGQWLFEVTVIGEMNESKGTFYIVVSTDCDCNITSIVKKGDKYK